MLLHFQSRNTKDKGRQECLPHQCKGRQLGCLPHHCLLVMVVVWLGAAVSSRAEERVALPGTAGVRMEGASAALVGKSAAFQAYAVRWRAFGDVYGEGLLLKPIGVEPVADVVAISDADQTPEMIAGLHEGLPRPAQYARALAEMGCRVIVPVLL